MLTSNDAVKNFLLKRAVKKEMLLIFNRLHRAVTTNTLFSMMDSDTRVTRQLEMHDGMMVYNHQS